MWRLVLRAVLDGLLRPLHVAVQPVEIRPVVTSDRSPPLPVSELANDLVEAEACLSAQPVCDQELAPAEPRPHALGPEGLGRDVELAREVTDNHAIAVRARRLALDGGGTVLEGG